MKSFKRNEQNKLPLFFKPILWSYNFYSMDIQKNKKTIIINAINYGDLKHWRWIIKNYGKENIKETLMNVYFTEIRLKVVPLISIIFSIDKFNHASRSNS